MIVVGLTGSIGMGKSTVAASFATHGIPVFDADAVVHALYARDGAAVAPVGERFPGVVKNGAVDRKALSAAVFGNPENLAALEAIVHPLVRAAEQEFIATARRQGAGIVVVEIQLLFETGADSRFDLVIVVSAPASVQRTRALKRPGMDEDKLAAILARQLPDAEIRARADIVIDTDRPIGETEQEVAGLVARLRRLQCTREVGDA